MFTEAQLISFTKPISESEDKSEPPPAKAGVFLIDQASLVHNLPAPGTGYITAPSEPVSRQKSNGSGLNGSPAAWINRKTK